MKIDAQELVSLIIGPVGALVLALVVLYLVARVVWILWKEHLRADQDDRDQRDKAQELLSQSLSNNAEAIAAWNKRNELDSARRRREDRQS